MQVRGVRIQEVSERNVRGDQVRRGEGTGAQTGQSLPVLQSQSQASVGPQGG